MNIELNHLWALFNGWMNNQNLSPKATSESKFLSCTWTWLLVMVILYYSQQGWDWMALWVIKWKLDGAKSLARFFANCSVTSLSPFATKTGVNMDVESSEFAVWVILLSQEVRQPYRPSPNKDSLQIISPIFVTSITNTAIL